MTETMTPGTRAWAEQKAREGAKVRWKGWSPEVWVTIADDKMRWKDGIFSSAAHFGILGMNDGWSIYAPTPEPTLADLEMRLAAAEGAIAALLDVAAGKSVRFTTSRIPNAATEEALDDVAAGRVTRHETFADLMADLNGPDEPAPTFTTSRKPEPDEVVMGDDEIAEAVRKAIAPFDMMSADVRIGGAISEAIRLTRASIRAQLAANEAGAVGEFYRHETIEDAIAAALKAHKEGV